MALQSTAGGENNCGRVSNWWQMVLLLLPAVSSWSANWATFSSPKWWANHDLNKSKQNNFKLNNGSSLYNQRHRRGIMMIIIIVIVILNIKEWWQSLSICVGVGGGWIYGQYSATLRHHQVLLARESVSNVYFCSRNRARAGKSRMGPCSHAGSQSFVEWNAG